MTKGTILGLIILTIFTYLVFEWQDKNTSSDGKIVYFKDMAVGVDVDGNNVADFIAINVPWSTYYEIMSGDTNFDLNCKYLDREITELNFNRGSMGSEVSKEAKDAIRNYQWIRK